MDLELLDPIDFYEYREGLFGDPDVSAEARVQGLLSTAAASPHVRNGIDGARYQGYPNFEVVREAGVNWCAWKATQGRSYVDPTFRANRARIAAAGIAYRPYYHWLTPGNRPIDEVRHFINTVGALAPGEGVMLDCEQAGITEEQSYATGDLLRQHYQRPVCIYSGRYVDGGRIIFSDRIRALGPFIFAAYTSHARAVALAGPRGFDAWQFLGGAGRCPGVDGPCDNDWIPDMRRFDAACGVSATIPQPLPEDNMQYVTISLTDADARFIAKRDTLTGAIIEGEWTGPGSDPDVRDRLAFLAKAPKITMGVNDLRLMTLHGPLPFGDSRHVWTGAEFFRCQASA